MWMSLSSNAMREPSPHQDAKRDHQVVDEVELLCLVLEGLPIFQRAARATKYTSGNSEDAGSHGHIIHC